MLRERAEDKFSPILGWGMVLIVILGGVKFGWLPLYAWHEQNIERITRLRQSVAEKKAISRDAHAIASRLTQAESALSSVKALFYTDFKDAPAMQLMLQKRLEALASKFQIQIRRTDWLYPSEGEMTQAPVALTCVADPNGLIKFLAALETDRLFFTIDRMTLMANGNRTSLDAELVVSAYGWKTERQKGLRHSQEKVEKKQAKSPKAPPGDKVDSGQKIKPPQDLLDHINQMKSLKKP